MAYMTHP